MMRAAILWGLGVTALAAASPLGAFPSLAQGTPPAAPSAPQADPVYEGARAAYDALPEATRRAIQDALVWTGDHNGTVSGEFGRRTFAAIVAWQRRAGLEPNGVLLPKARQDLEAAAERARAAIGFKVLTDDRTGVRIGIPDKILPKQGVNPNGGGRWQSADDRITLDTRAIASGEADLKDLFERNLAIQTPGRKVTYKLLRDDFYVITGETPTGRFFTRYASGPAGIRGFSIGYDKALAKELDRTVIAIANSFAPFGSGEPAAVAGAPTPKISGPGPSPGSTIAPVTVGSAPLASGLAVAPRRILTGAMVAACPDLRVGGGKARMAALDREAGLALLATDRDHPAPPLALADAGPDPIVLSYSAGVAQREPMLVATSAATMGSRVLAPLQPGSSGAPVFSRTGALAGVVGEMPAAPRMIAGVVPPLTLPLASGPALMRFLADRGVTTAASEARPRTTGEIAALIGPSVVSITCAR